MKNKNISFKIGHVLIQVDHLETAILQYRQMGFQVVSGGLPGKAHNALIYLKDGSFLELFCTNHGKFMNALLEVMVKLIGIFNLSYSSRLGLCSSAFYFTGLLRLCKSHFIIKTMLNALHGFYRLPFPDENISLIK